MSRASPFKNAMGRPIDGGRGDSISGERLYQKVARALLSELRKGLYAIGQRLPAERELAAIHGVSRPAIREAVLALEVLGLVEVRIGSGAYVVALPDHGAEPQFDVSAFELMEARVLFEGEAAALAALHITDYELDELDKLVNQISAANRRDGRGEAPDETFHKLVARASRNKAVEEVVRSLWEMRSASPECALLLEKARTANVQPVVDEHLAIVAALRSRDANRARQAMRAHLSAVIEHLLFAIEEETIETVRADLESKRQRYTKASSI